MIFRLPAFFIDWMEFKATLMMTSRIAFLSMDTRGTSGLQ